MSKVFSLALTSPTYFNVQLFNLEVMPSGLDDYGIVITINMVELAHVGLELFLYGGTLAMAKCS